MTPPPDDTPRSVAEPDREAAARMWQDYVDVHPQHRGDHPPSEWFGDSAELADELLELALHGPKRATAGSAEEYAVTGEPMPRIGSHWVLHDGSGRPRAILRTIELRLGPLDSVDERFAWDEGEDDRSRESWLREHRRYFQRFLPTIGLQFSESMEILFERFRVVWPPEHADLPGTGQVPGSTGDDPAS